VTTSIPPDWRRARRALFVYFVAHSAVTASWVVSIPVITVRLGLRHETVGVVLMVVAGGAVIAVQVIARPLLRRYSTRSHF